MIRDKLKFPLMTMSVKIYAPIHMSDDVADLLIIQISDKIRERIKEICEATCHNIKNGEELSVVISTNI